MMVNLFNNNPENDTIEVTCPLCRTDNKKLFGNFHFQGQLLGLVECQQCCLVYVSPHLSDERMTEYFQSYTDVYSNEAIEWWHYNKLPNIKVDLGILKSYCPQGKLLDVGCGHGFFMKQAQRLGYDIFGVEVSDQACEYASRQLDLDVRMGPLEELDLTPDSFDVVTLFDTLDYLVDPLSELIQIKKLLRKGGVLIVRVLNRIQYARLWQRIFVHTYGGDFQSYDMNPFLEKDHIIHFNQPTLESTLTKSGFKVIKTFNARLSYLPQWGRIHKFSRQLAVLGFELIWLLSGYRRCFAPSLTMVTRNP